MKKLYLTAIALLFFYFGFGQSAARIDRLLDSIFPKNEPGIAIEIKEKGTVIFAKGYGLADIPSGKNNQVASNFNIASLTKQFTAAGILYLKEKGKLALSDTIAKYFPDMNPQVAKKVTIQQLLSHSSGILDHYSYVKTEGLQHGYARQVYEAIKDKDSFYFPPGSSYRYSNTAYCLLGLIIEKVSRMKYADFMAKYLFSRAGMRHTTVWEEKKKIFRQTTGYDKDSISGQFKKSQAEEHVFFSTEGDGAIYTSVEDYGKWFDALQKGKIVSTESLLGARAIHNPIAPHLGYGYGWFVDDNQQPIYVYHSGDNGGFRTYSFTVPMMDYMVVVFANRSDVNVENIVQQINKILHPELPDFTPIEEKTS
ncbi:MAG: serine hydrolase domain-containing protein [Chitinophagaceae bacterium]